MVPKSSPQLAGPAAESTQPSRQDRRQRFLKTYPRYMQHRITVDPERMGGAPTIRDTRVTVVAVLGQLAAGSSVEELLADYPYLEREDVLAVLAFAAEQIPHEIPFSAA